MPEKNTPAKKNKDKKKKDQQHSDSESQSSAGSDIIDTTGSPVRIPGQAEVHPSTSQQHRTTLPWTTRQQNVSPSRTASAQRRFNFSGAINPGGTQCPPARPTTMDDGGDGIFNQEMLSQAVLQLVRITQAT